MSIPGLRLRAANQAPVRPEGEYVLYWMTAFRRLAWNFALDRAVERARELGKPLVVFEPLRCGYLWASDRFHRFVIAGMAEHERRLAGSGILYFPYVEPRPGVGSGLLAALAERACLVVADDAPVFFLPRMLAAAAAALSVRVEAVDSNGLLPLLATDRVYPTAYLFRRFLQKELPAHLGSFPAEKPFAGGRLAPAPVLPEEIGRRWPAASADLLAGGPESLADLPIDHVVAPVAAIPGGSAAGRRALEEFLADRLDRYGEARNEPAEQVTSGLSPYLHFGHVSTHEAFASLASHEEWTPQRIGPDRRGAKEGWWGASAAAESFLDELVTWREVGYNMASKDQGSERYESLPDWARRTLAAHAGDLRPHLYTLPELEGASTHDEIWNAAQSQLVAEGRIHNYLRMLWGKKILEWSPSPQVALSHLIHLNNKYALDGRDPNSASGIFWCLGRYDRPWAPERPIFGSVRFMSSDSARRKLRLGPYLERWAPGVQLRLA